MRFRASLATVAVAATMLSAVVASGPSAEAIPPSSARLFMVSDSVGLGAKGAIANAFAGWQVTVTGKPGLFTEQLVRYVTQAPLSQFGDDAVVATGYNYPYWAPTRFDASIDQMMSALLAKGVQRVYWVTMREVKPAWYSKWNGLAKPYQTLYRTYPFANDQLRNAMSRWPQLSILDWAAITDQAGVTSDAIHFFGDYSVGALRYAAMVFNGVTNGRTRRPSASVTQVQITGTPGVPDDAVAASLTITAVQPRQGGFVTAYACGTERPTVANLNHRAAENVASLAVVPIGPDGTVCLYQSAASHLVVDLNGVFTCSNFVPPTPSRPIEGLRTQGVSVIVPTDANGDVCLHATGGVHLVLDLLAAFPVSDALQPTFTHRVVDTRTAGGALAPLVDREVIAAGDGSAMVTLTAVDPQGIGYVTARPCGTDAGTSVLNVVPNHQQSGSAIVSLATGLCVRSSVSTHVLVDSWGVAGDAYQAITPVRLLDTRV